MAEPGGSQGERTGSSSGPSAGSDASPGAGSDTGSDASSSSSRFALDWRLDVDHEAAEELAAALEPEMDTYARLLVEEGTLRIEGQGSPGESLHTLDDILACLTGAVEALEATADPGSDDEPA